MSQLPLYLTTDYPCSYLPKRQARNLVAEPQQINQTHYQALLLQGFRRSGEHVYRPHCYHCQACQSLRVASEYFRPSRAQRRVGRRNHDLRLRQRPMTHDEEHFHLFQRYAQYRHPDGGMDAISAEDFFAFTTSAWCHSRLWELRDSADRLLCGAVVDHLTDGFSAVYSYFEPLAPQRSLGTLIILHQLWQAKHLGLPWIYLGYYIENCSKMDYKARFHPHQRFMAGQWYWQN